jgi:hypothetical protein
MLPRQSVPTLVLQPCFRCTSTPLCAARQLVRQSRAVLAAALAEPLAARQIWRGGRYSAPQEPYRLGMINPAAHWVVAEIFPLMPRVVSHRTKNAPDFERDAPPLRELRGAQAGLIKLCS